MTKAKTSTKTMGDGALEPAIFTHDGYRIYVFEGVPYMTDDDLADRLGFGRERDIRKLIKRQEANLVLLDGLGHGVPNPTLGLRHRVANPRSPKGGRPGIAYYLTQAQVRWIVIKSETPEADVLLRQLFSVFDAWEKGQLITRDEAAHHAGQPTPALPFDLSKGLAPVPEVHAWAWSFSVKDKQKIQNIDVPRAATTNDGVTLHVVGTTPCMTASDIGRLAGPEEALIVGDIVRSNLPLFEKHGKVWITSKSGAGRKRGAAPDHLLNAPQAGALLGLLEARGAPKAVSARVAAIFRAYFERTLSDLCSDPTQKSNAIAMEQARVGYVIDAHGYVHRTHDENGRPVSPYHWLPPVRINLERVVSHFDGDRKPVYMAGHSIAPVP